MLIRVHAVGLNPTDAATLKNGAPGSVIGHEFAGTVTDAAADGSGPQPGTRVAGFAFDGAAPSRESLIITVHRRDVAELVASARTLLRNHAPFEALSSWCDQLASYGRLKHGLAGALYGVIRTDLGKEGYEPVIGAITLLIDAGKRVGTVRPDVDAEELLVLLGFLWRIRYDIDWGQRASHMMTLVLDGVRPPHDGIAHNA